ASTFPLKNDNVTPGAAHAHHLDDVAIQAWVMEASGLDCARVELNLLNNQWRYPGGDDYRGLFRQLDVTGLLSERRAQVPIWLKAAQEIVAGPMPSALTGKQCSDPYDCPFVSFCKTQESPEPQHPIELLPDSAGKALARTLREGKGLYIHPGTRARGARREGGGTLRAHAGRTSQWASNLGARGS